MIRVARTFAPRNVNVVLVLLVVHLRLGEQEVDAHGGDAWVEDRPGGGARFRVSFTEVC